MRLITLALLCCLPLFAGAADNPRVRLQTSQGNITLELYPEKAPKTVENFLDYVKSGFYDDTVFHRVIEDFMIQGGGFDTDLERKDTRAPVANEADNGLSNQRGAIAMARTSDPHSATAQFFINTVDNPALDFTAKTPRGWGYTVFGKVVEGMATVDNIAALETRARGPMRNLPTETVVIREATVIESPADASAAQDTAKEQ